MAVYFFDSSAIVKRYLNETGTVWVSGITDLATGNKVYLARITLVEVISAILNAAAIAEGLAVDDPNAHP